MGERPVSYVMMNLKITFLLLATLTVGINCASTGAEVEAASRGFSPLSLLPPLHLFPPPPSSPSSSCTPQACQLCPCRISTGSCHITPHYDCDANDAGNVESCAFYCGTDQAAQDLCDALVCSWENGGNSVTGSCSNIAAAAPTRAP